MNYQVRIDFAHFTEQLVHFAHCDALDAPDTIISDIDGRDTFNAAGIKFQMIDAMRKWRIIFNGLAKRVQNGEESEVHLRINVMWTNFSRPYEIKREFSRKMLAAAMTREKWTGQEQFLRVRLTKINSNYLHLPVNSTTFG